MDVMLPMDRGRVASEGRAEVVADWLSRWRGRPVTVRVAQSYAELERAIREGAIDLAWAPPLVCARVAAHVRRVLVCVRGGARGTRSALLVRDDSPIHRAADLAGRRAGWVDPLSLHGHLSPRAYLGRGGVDVAELLEAERFCGSYRDALLALVEGQIDVSALYARVDADEAAVRRVAVDVVGQAAEGLRVLDFTDPCLNDALVLTRRVSRSQTDRLTEELAALRTRGSRTAMLLEHVSAERLEPVDATEYARLAALSSGGAPDRTHG